MNFSNPSVKSYNKLDLPYQRTQHEGPTTDLTIFSENSGLYHFLVI